jgi:cytochrome P450
LVLDIRRDPLGTLLSLARKYGDVVRIPVLLEERILLNHPSLIEQVLIVQQAKFHKSELTKRIVGPLLGEGLLTSEGDSWRRQRRLAQPAFHRHRINQYSSTMIECAQKLEQSWSDGSMRDIAQDMMALTLDAAVRTLFGATLPGDAEQVGKSLTFLMRYSLGRARSPVSIPDWVPTPRNRRAEREFEYFDSLVYGIIAERKANLNSSQQNDLLSLLMRSMDDDGSRMTPKQLRDEIMTLFLAGHETTAITLAWTWYLLSENRQVESRLHEELDRVLAGRVPEIADLERLPYLYAVITETLRLYPAAYILARTSVAPFSLGGYDFPQGTTVILSQWVMHRDPRFYEDPGSFRPERWLDGLENRLPAGAYFPFGDGPRRCIGQGFALLEAALVIATIAQRFQFRLVPGHPVLAEPLVTLRPRRGIHMTIHAR